MSGPTGNHPLWDGLDELDDEAGCPMSEHTPLTEAERARICICSPDLLPAYEGSSHTYACSQHRAAVERILAVRTSTATAECSGCRPCPGRGNDGHGMTHCAECCFGTGVEADVACPVHGDPAMQATATADTGLRERVERAERLIDAWEHDAPGLVDPTFIGRLRETLRRDPAPVRLRDATPASTEDRADNEGTR